MPSNSGNQRSPVQADHFTPAKTSDTTTIKETLAETAENLAHLMEREAEKAPDEEPQVSLNALAEVVADKGYHSNDAILAVQQAEAT